MKRWLSELIRRTGLAADLPALGIAALCAAAILATAAASVMPGPLFFGLLTA
jgi:hypothetical protein